MSIKNESENLDDKIASPGNGGGFNGKPSLNGLVREGLTFVTSATARKVFFTLADQAVASITNFLTGVIIGRTCVKEEFGLYILGFTIVFITTNLQSSLITIPYMVYSPRLKGIDHRQYTGSTLIHQLGFAGLAVIVLSISGIIIAIEGSFGLARVIWVLVGVITLLMLRDYLRQFCFAGLRMKTALLLDGCLAVFQIGGLLLLAHYKILSATNAFWVIGIACGIVSIVCLTFLRKLFIPSIQSAIKDFSHNWEFGKWVFASTIATIVSAELYPWIIAGFHGTAATADLGVCKNLIMITNPFLMGITNFLGPKTSHAYAHGGKKELRHIVFYSSIVIVFSVSMFVLAVVFFGGKLIVLIYGSKYVGYGHVVTILVIGRLITSMALATNCGLLAIERSNVIFKSNLISAFITLTFGGPFVWYFNVTGAALAVTGSTTVSAIYRLVCFWSYTRKMSDDSHHNLLDNSFRTMEQISEED